MLYAPKPHRSAFSLVELSIVLVILGLLVGGILSGRALIRASELRAITTEKDKYTAAIFSFRDKYFQWPGDLNNAFQFWGATCGTNTTTASTGCNGDGDGSITDSNNNGENIKVWEHLSRAGLVEGSYDGTGNVVGLITEVSASNIPKSRFSQGYWELSSLDLITSALYSNISSNLAGSADAVGHPILHMGTVMPGNSQLNAEPSLTRAEAWSIDKKIDDGKATTGKMRGDTSGSCFDVTTDYYDLQGTSGDGDANSTDCALHFILN